MSFFWWPLIVIVLAKSCYVSQEYGIGRAKGLTKKILAETEEFRRFSSIESCPSELPSISNHNLKPLFSLRHSPNETRFNLGNSKKENDPTNSYTISETKYLFVDEVDDEYISMYVISKKAGILVSITPISPTSLERLSLNANIKITPKLSLNIAGSENRSNFIPTCTGYYEDPYCGMTTQLHNCTDSIASQCYNGYKRVDKSGSFSRDNVLFCLKPVPNARYRWIKSIEYEITLSFTIDIILGEASVKDGEALIPAMSFTYNYGSEDDNYFEFTDLLGNKWGMEFKVDWNKYIISENILGSDIDLFISRYLDTDAITVDDILYQTTGLFDTGDQNVWRPSKKYWLSQKPNIEMYNCNLWSEKEAFFKGIEYSKLLQKFEFEGYWKGSKSLLMFGQGSVLESGYMDAGIQIYLYRLT